MFALELISVQIIGMAVKKKQRKKSKINRNWYYLLHRRRHRMKMHMQAVGTPDAISTPPHTIHRYPQ